MAAVVFAKHAGMDAGYEAAEAHYRNDQDKKPLPPIRRNISTSEMSTDWETLQSGESLDDDVYDGRGVSEEKGLAEVIAEKFSAMYDRSIRRRNAISVLCGVVANALMMVMLYLGFDRKKCWAHVNLDGLSDEDIAALMPDDTDRPCYTETTLTFVLKCGMSFTVFVHALMILQYYRFQFASEKRSRWFIPDGAFWRSHAVLILLFELLIVLYHPFPVGTGENTIYDDKLSVFMLLRVYLLIRSIRDTSSVYRSRAALLNDRVVKQSGAVEFDWLLSVKFVFLKNTWLFVVTTVLSGWVLFAYFIWVFEREQNFLFTLEKSIWMVGITFSTVGYGDISPVSGIGKVVTGFAAVAGILFTALLVFAVMDSLTLTPQDARVKNLWIRQGTTEAHRDYAAKYIQVTWRHFRKMRTLHIHSPEARVEIKQFNSLNVFMKGLLRGCRRQMLMATAVDDLVMDRLVRKLEGLSVSVANRLALRLGVRPHGKMKHELDTLPDLNERVQKAVNEQRKMADIADEILHVLLTDEKSEASDDRTEPLTPRGGGGSFFDSFF